MRIEERLSVDAVFQDRFCQNMILGEFCCFIKSKLMILQKILLLEICVSISQLFDKKSCKTIIKSLGACKQGPRYRGVRALAPHAPKILRCILSKILLFCKIWLLVFDMSDLSGLAPKNKKLYLRLCV